MNASLRKLMGLRENWPLHLALAAYVVLVFAVIARHEPWADEAQAWLLARDSGLFELLFKRLHYEGHPGLWYLVLFVPSKLFPYRVLSILSGGIAILGVAVLLYRSNFPKLLRVLLVFTYFLFYQYAVIARSYVLIPLLLFLTASTYHRRHEHPFEFAILVSLLAYTSVYAALISVSLMLVHAVEFIQRRQWASVDPMRKHVAIYAIFVAALAVIAVQLWEPADGTFARGYRFDLAHFYTLGKQILNEITTDIGPLSALLLVISLVWFWQRRVLLIYILPTSAILGLFSVKYYNSWHQGIPFLVWVFALWISFSNREPDRWQAGSRVFRLAAQLVCVVVAGFHVYWAAVASYNDWGGSYSGASATAEYIEENGLTGKPIYATTFWTTAIQPYFASNILANHNNGNPPAYWLWAKPSGRMEVREQMLKAQPELIVLGRPSEEEALPGYRRVAIFEGNIYWKAGIKEKNHFGVYRRE